MSSRRSRSPWKRPKPRRVRSESGPLRKPRPRVLAGGAYAVCVSSAPHDEETGELRREQAARRGEEGERAETAEHEAERRQHARRADKAAYLEEKLSERERTEREAE